MSKSAHTNIAALIGLGAVGVGFCLYSSLGLALIVVGSIMLVVALASVLWG